MNVPSVSASKPQPAKRYRLLCANPATGHMELERHFEAANDDIAIRCADEWRVNRVAELWRSYRVVKHWKTP